MTFTVHYSQLRNQAWKRKAKEGVKTARARKHGGKCILRGDSGEEGR